MYLRDNHREFAHTRRDAKVLHAARNRDAILQLPLNTSTDLPRSGPPGCDVGHTDRRCYFSKASMPVDILDSALAFKRQEAVALAAAPEGTTRALSVPASP